MGSNSYVSNILGRLAYKTNITRYTLSSAWTEGPTKQKQYCYNTVSKPRQLPFINKTKSILLQYSSKPDNSLSSTNYITSWACCKSLFIVLNISVCWSTGLEFESVLLLLGCAAGSATFWLVLIMPLAALCAGVFKIMNIKSLQCTFHTRKLCKYAEIKLKIQ